MTWLLILLGMVILWWVMGQKNSRKLKLIAKEMLTDIPPMQLVGHAYLYFGTDEDRMLAFQKFGRDAIKRGGVAAIWHASQLYIFVADPEIGEILLKSCLAKDEHTIRFTRVIFGNGSIFAPVNIWRPRRKILAPVFSPKNLNGFMKIFTKQSATMVERLRPMAGTGDFSIWKYVTSYTFDAVAETNLGVIMDTQKQDDHPFLEAFDIVGGLVAARMCQPWLYSDWFYRLLPSYWTTRRCTKYLNSFVQNIIKEKRESLKANGYCERGNTNAEETKTPSFLDMMLESSGYNDTELREEILVIMVAGTDTSAIGTCFTLLMLARYPEIQEAVYKELFEVFGNSDREVTVEDLPKLKYLEAVMKESLRLNPPVPVIMREVHEDVKLPTGTTLVKGVRVATNIWAMHRNHRYWGDDAEIFRPERFLDGPLKHPVQFMPFSYGMRNCLGYQYAMMSMKTALASLLRRFVVLPPAGLDPSRYHDPLRVRFDLMMRHVDNYIVRLENSYLCNKRAKVFFASSADFESRASEGFYD